MNLIWWCSCLTCGGRCWRRSLAYAALVSMTSRCCLTKQDVSSTSSEGCLHQSPSLRTLSGVSGVSARPGSSSSHSRGPSLLTRCTSTCSRSVSASDSAQTRILSLHSLQLRSSSPCRKFRHSGPSWSFSFLILLIWLTRSRSHQS